MDATIPGFLFLVALIAIPVAVTLALLAVVPAVRRRRRTVGRDRR